MKSMQLIEFKEQLNAWGQNRVPFLFLIDFEMKKPLVWRVDQVDPNDILYSVNAFSNAPKLRKEEGVIRLQKFPLSFYDYERKFNCVHEHLLRGNSFLVNLTIKTKVEIDLTTHALFHLSNAKYKCWWRDHFLFFSPETFFQIRNGKIFSYPMKGTIDALVENAHEVILENKKELAEHITIVDLIRNDLSQVAMNVSISRFRYIEEVVAHDKRLLQVSSEIVGDLHSDYHSQLGEIIVTLLPAGSVSGAPKAKTCEIIKEVEGEDRGYYTGVFGYFDGENLDSCVAIRYLEQKSNELYYRSGGGITALSIAEEEYKEAIQKIYVPVT